MYLNKVYKDGVIETIAEGSLDELESLLIDLEETGEFILKISPRCAKHWKA